MIALCIKLYSSGHITKFDVALHDLHVFFFGYDATTWLNESKYIYFFQLEILIKYIFLLLKRGTH